MKDNTEILSSLFQMKEEYPILKPGLEIGGVIIGGYAAKVYYQPAKDQAKGDNPVIGIIKVSSAVGINTLVNAYYNYISVQLYLDLRYADTKKLIMPKSHSLILGFMSVTSAFCFAVLSFKDANNNSRIPDFCVQMLIYTAQHFVAMLEIYKLIPEWPSNKKSKALYRNKQNEIVTKLETALNKLNQGFKEKTLTSENFFNENDLDENYLIDWINEQILEDEVKPKSSSCLFTILYSTIQIIGFVATMIGNVGFHNDTQNSLKKAGLSEMVAWFSSSFCMIPVWALGILSTYRSIDKIFSLNIFDILRDIKKTSWINTSIKIISFSLTILSYASALQLLQEAIYGGSSENPANFSSFDTADQIMRPWYEWSTRLTIIFFNAIPVPEVAEFGESLYNRKFPKSNEVKQEYAVIEHVKKMRDKAVTSSAAVFLDSQQAQNQVVVNIQNGHIEDDKSVPLLSQRAKEKNCCQIMTDYIYSFFTRRRVSPAVQADENKTNLCEKMSQTMLTWV